MEPISIYKEHNRTFDEMAAYQPTTLSLTGSGEPQRVVAANVTASFFDIFQAPVLGRRISVEEDQPGGNAVVVMSDRLWSGVLSLASPTDVPADPST